MPKRNKNPESSIVLVKAAFLQQFKLAMKDNGVEVEPYLKRFRLPVNDVNDSDTYLPGKPFWHLINQVAIEEIIPDFGMQVAQVTPWYKVESMQKFLARSRSLASLLDAFCEIASAQSSNARFNTHVEDGQCWFEYHGVPVISNDIQMELYRVASMIELVQLATGKNWRPLEVRLMMNKNRVVEKNCILDDCELVFSQTHTAIVFPAGLLDATITTRPDDSPGDIDINESLKLDDIQNRTKLVNALHEIFSFYVTEDKLTINMIADIVGLSTRSLQRVMKKHDISYNALLNTARQQYAETQLKNPEVKISDIAYQLGYNDTAHFTRAFKRWTGMTPSQYRNSRHQL